MKISKSFGLTGLLVVTAAFATHAGADVGVGGHYDAAEVGAGLEAQPIEEIVVYGRRVDVDADQLAAALREQMRVVTERLNAEISVELKELAAPRLQVAGADISLVVNLPQA